jgi:hypothetical protein
LKTLSIGDHAEQASISPILGMRRSREALSV